MTGALLDHLTLAELGEYIAVRAWREQHEAEQRTAASADAFDWPSLRAWLPADHPDKWVGIPDRPSLGAYCLARCPA